MTSKVPKSMEAWVRERIQAGQFADEDAAIETGLTLLREREQKIARLKEMLRDGEASIEREGLGDYQTPEELIAELEAQDAWAAAETT